MKFLILAIFFFSLPLNANPFVEKSVLDSNWELNAHLGASFAEVVRPKENSESKKNQRIDIGGVNAIITGNSDVSDVLGVNIGGALLFDFINSQIAQQSIRASLLFHILGAPKRIRSGPNGSGIKITSYSNDQVSFITQGAFLNYAATTEDLSTKLSGSVFETRLGFRYRFSFSEIFSGGLELLTTLYSVPANENRLESKTSEVSIFVQI